MAEQEYKPVEFEIINEDWNHYELSDGTTIKFKAVVQQIFEKVGTIDEITGLPNYTVRSSNVVSVVPPEAE